MLVQKLRKLRFGHAAAVLEAHHQAAINAKLGSLEFLETLVDDELSTRDNKGLDRRFRPLKKAICERISVDVAGTDAPSGVQFVL